MFNIFYIKKENEYGKPYTYYYSSNTIREEFEKCIAGKKEKPNHSCHCETEREAELLTEKKNKNQWYYIFDTIYDNYRRFVIWHKFDMEHELPQGSILRDVTEDWDKVKAQCPMRQYWA